MANTRLSHLFHITERFQRSVHLERDFYTENALDGYVVTVKARETLSRLISAQTNGATSKAWSLTGPYGSGKSAFALFAAKLLGNSDSATTQQALELLRRGDPSLYEQFVSTNGNGTSLSGYCRVLISGERASLPIALLQGLERGLQNFGISYTRAPRQNIRKLLKASLNDLPPHASEITALFESATRAIAKNGGQGLLLVIDELGKFLEYAAQHPAQGDVFVLQTLAEFATRSDQTPLFLVTILHQAFEQYANKLAKSQREEWAKVQGRFEDIAFVEPADQILRLIGSAIQHTSVRETENLSIQVRSDLKSNQLSRTEFSQLLQNCLPLHPTVALIIGPIFRRFAQNERSLFAFLNASEPYGLQDFLEKQHYDGQTLPMFSIADLYDYLNTTIGSRLSTSNEGGKWVEIEMAINRLTDASPIQVKLIKTIGLLGIIGEVSTNLKTSESILRYALDDCSERFTEEFKTALKLLTTERSLAIYRRHSDTYALWEGSDIDIAAKRQEAEQRFDPNEKLMTYLSRLTPPRPLIARRHLFEKGTLRYFTVRYTDLEDFDAHLNEPLGDADGMMLYTLPASETEITQLTEKAKEATSREEVLIAIPDSTRFLHETVTELAYLQWVWENTPELDNDTVAKRELSHRQIAAEQNVAEQFAAVFGDNSKKACKWFHKGAQVPINPQRARNEYLSQICDTIYDKTPIIWNELINRRKISGTVTTARKKLIQVMLENGDQRNLGIIGYPAEMSIYRSLLLETGIHREVSSDVWGFHPPESDDENRMVHTWKAIEDFLETCEGERQSVIKLYERLMAPPYGVRSGPLPILLCAAMLRYKTEIALYQDGSFIPNWSMPVFERFLKVPEKFEIKRFRIIEARAELLRQYLNALNQPTETETPDLLTVIQALMPFISRLPKYTLNTKTLSDNAKNLRASILNAREPDELLFKELPEALGFSAFGIETTDSNAATKFSRSLQSTLSELGRAYENLLNSIEKQIKDAFVLTGDRDTCREALVHRAEPLREITSEPQLIQFLIRICDEQLDTTSWLEAIGAMLAGKPPNAWFDRDTDTFKSNFFQVVRKFRHIEALSYEEREHIDSPTGEPIRIGITRPNQAEQERVVTLTPDADEQTSEIEGAIKKVLQDFNVDDNPELHIAILAKISQHWIQQLDE